jgi:hypothetical protein
MYSLDNTDIFDRIQDAIIEMNIEEEDEAMSYDLIHYREEIAEEVMLGL